MASEFTHFHGEYVLALIWNERLLEADYMGLGKTSQVIAELRILLVRWQIESALVVAPANLLDQWRQALTKSAPESRVDNYSGSANGPRLAEGGPGLLLLEAAASKVTPKLPRN